MTKGAVRKRPGLDGGDPFPPAFCGVDRDPEGLRNRSIVSSELDGILNAIRVDEGSPVTRNQLIAEIKETDYRLAMEQATAILKQAEAALANTKLEHQRKEALYKEELVTKQQFDDVVGPPCRCPGGCGTGEGRSRSGQGKD